MRSEQVEHLAEARAALDEAEALLRQGVRKLIRSMVLVGVGGFLCGVAVGAWLI